jgi:urease accessory protein
VPQTHAWLPRTEGSIRLGFTRRGAASHIDVLNQAGAARVRFPRPAGGGIEAVLVNSAGGLTGGDRIAVAVALAAACDATVTSAAAEKIYRAQDHQAAQVKVELTLAAGARLCWLPQPTIVFNGARLERRTEVALAADGTLLALEILIFGRAAMGERVAHGALDDVWRVRRAGTLVFAEALRLKGAIGATLRKTATFAGARASALLIYVAPDAVGRLGEAQARVQAFGSTAGASAFNGLLLVRALAADGGMLQKDMCALMEWLSARPLPRVWHS